MKAGRGFLFELYLYNSSIMRYHIFATDYDGTIAKDERVSAETLDYLQKLKLTGRTIVLVTGRELDSLEIVFPEYKIFDYIVAENGAVIHFTLTGKDELLGEKPPQSFIHKLVERGVGPISVGKVIVATWEPHQNTVLETIREFGLEQQVIFNKGAVMILPPAVNKATGLKALLKLLSISEHNIVAVGDAENDSAMMQIAEYSVAVSNALPSLKDIVDFVTPADHGEGVQQLIDKILTDEDKMESEKQARHYLSTLR